MAGKVGYSDVAPFFKSEPNGQKTWWDSRSTVEMPTDLEDRNPVLQGWLSDDCPKLAGLRYAKYAWDLDSWTEYWDIYRPETKGCYYFGSADCAGYLNQFLPNPVTGRRSPVFDVWKALIFSSGDASMAAFEEQFYARIRQPEVKEAVLAVDELVRRLLRNHFTDETGKVDIYAYLDCMERFGKDTLPECRERFERIADDDARKPTSLHHTIEGDVMWFAWALHLECAQSVAAPDAEATAVRAILLAGIAQGCAFDYAFRRGYRTRKEYRAADSTSRASIWSRSLLCAGDFSLGARELRELFRIRTYGDQS